MTQPILGPRLECRIEIGERVRARAVGRVTERTMDMNIHVGRLQRECAIKIRNRMHVVALLRMNESTLIECGRKLWLDRNRPVEIANGAIELSADPICFATTNIARGETRIEGYC